MSIPYSGGTNIHAEFDAYGHVTLLTNLNAQLVLAGWTSAAVKAYANYTLSTNAANGQTVTIDGTVYTFKTAIINGNPREVLIGASAAATLANLYNCINDTGVGKGTTYSSATTAHTTCDAVDPVGGTTMKVQAKTGGAAGNAIQVSEVSNGGWDSTTMRNGGHKLTSGKTPQGLQMKVHLYWAGDNNYVYARPTDVDEVVPACDPWLLYSTPGLKLRIIAGPYQFFVYSLGVTTTLGCDLGMGVPYLPEHIQGQVINSATHAAPIVLGFAAAHGLQTNDQVYITGCEGNTAANGLWTITKVNDTSYSLNTSTGNGTYTANSGRAGLSTKKITRAIWSCAKYGNTYTYTPRTGLQFPVGGAGPALFVCNQNAYSSISGQAYLHPPISQVQRFWFGGRGVVGEAVISWPPTSAGGTGEVIGVLWDALLINRAFSVDVEPTDTYDGKKWHGYTGSCSDGTLFLMIP